ncbi:MAG: 50S ribosomal protein L29 [Flavobacteriaceae bacterium]|nr:50S ribosomal protein L29 [Flavobacteriaceae bacterium]|tara:strand:+ start:2616 stop:2810 length:195 start_codon:yes stop_codon:yes gene_type:complete
MKQKEVIEMSIDELNEKLTSFKKELSEMKMTHAVSPIENPLQIRNIRRTIARINSELSKRNQEQ